MVGISSIFSLHRLRRETTRGRYLPEIDGLRFVAVLSVVLYHIVVQVAQQPHGEIIVKLLDPALKHGNRGVQLFFVLSGFILGLPFARQHLSEGPVVRLRDYFYRRVTRLELPYVLMLLLRAALLLAVIHQPLSYVLPHLTATFFYAHSAIYGAYSTINPPAWSLEVEIQFYCLAPFLAQLIFTRLRTRLWRRSMLVATILFAGLLQHTYLLPATSGPAMRIKAGILFSIPYFLAGFLLCDLYILDWDKIRSHWLWDVVCIPLWVWIFWPDSSLWHLWLPLAAVIVYIGAFKGPVQRSVFRHPFICTTGGMCYSIYLSHNLVLTAAVALFRPLMHGPAPSLTAVWLVSGIITVLAFAVGLVYYVFLERPCMQHDWPQRLAERVNHWHIRPAHIRANHSVRPVA